MPYQGKEAGALEILPVEGSKYSISDRAVSNLNAYVANLEKNPPGKLVGQVDFTDALNTFDRKAVVAGLPQGLTETDLVSILRLSLLTECATEAYAKVFDVGSARFDAGWMGHFNRRIWTPDEAEHADPFKKILLGFGFSEEQLDREVADVQTMTYEHGAGETPLHLTIFGMVQEDLTAGWYGLTNAVIGRAAPRAAAGINVVTKRELFHIAWYRDMSAIQVLSDPNLIPYVADSLHRFKMPGNEVAPELQEQAARWIPLMGGDFRKIEQRLMRHVSAAVGGSAENIGRTVIEYGVRATEGSGLATTANSARLISGLPFVGRFVRTLVGQAFQQHEGMKPHGKKTEEFIWNATQPLRSLIAGTMKDFALTK